MGYLKKYIISGFIYLFVSMICFAGTTIKIGVLANRGESKCRQQWQATIDYLNNCVDNNSFELVPLKFDAVDHAVGKKKIDFILVNSSMYISLAIKHKVNRILTLETLFNNKAYNVFGGVIFTRRNNTAINKIEDLVDKKFMAVKDSSFGGWRLAWQIMKERKIDPWTELASLIFGGTHDSVVRAVLSGKVDAGTVRTGILEKMAIEGKITLKDLNNTQQETFTFDQLIKILSK
jgi:two-component system sensor histidine kinase TtrS